MDMNLSLARDTPERPRERLLAHGPQVLTSAELLAIVLRTGIKGCNVVELSHRLIQHCGGVRGLLAADAKTLMKLPGLGQAKACEILAISELKIGRASCRERV